MKYSDHYCLHKTLIRQRYNLVHWHFHIMLNKGNVCRLILKRWPIICGISMDSTRVPVTSNLVYALTSISFTCLMFFFHLHNNEKPLVQCLFRALIEISSVLFRKQQDSVVHLCGLLHSSICKLYWTFPYWHY